MAIVPGYEYDVFISYDHADNLPISEYRWVTKMWKDINATLNQIGLKGINIYFDEGDDPPSDSDDLREKVQKSAILLIVLSCNYSENTGYCLKERTWFLEKIEKQSHKSRIVMAKINECNPPPELEHIFYRSFIDKETSNIYSRKYKENEYIDELKKLANFIKKNIKKLRTPPPENDLIPQQAPYEKTTQAVKHDENWWRRDFSTRWYVSVGLIAIICLFIGYRWYNTMIKETLTGCWKCDRDNSTSYYWWISQPDDTTLTIKEENKPDRPIEGYCFYNQIFSKQNDHFSYTLKKEEIPNTKLSKIEIIPTNDKSIKIILLASDSKEEEITTFNCSLSNNQESCK